MSAPVVLVFDSGLGGLTVYREICRATLEAHVAVAPVAGEGAAGGPVAGKNGAASFIYLADDAVFPYGGLTPEALVARVVALLDVAIARFAPDIVVIACNTASTLVLPHLRARHAVPFVGTVPAIKPAAAVSRSRMISVLATPGTVARDYTRDLARDYAGDCEVQLVGSRRLATFAEQLMAGEPVADSDIAAEIAPCFQQSVDGIRRTDAVALACTHYPLLLPRFEALAPWPVNWIDPAPAIARRTWHLLEQAGFAARAAAADARPPVALFTGGARLGPPLTSWLNSLGVNDIRIDPLDSLITPTTQAPGPQQATGRAVA